MPNRDQLSAAVARELRAASSTQRRRSGAPAPAARRQTPDGTAPGRWLYPLASTGRLRELLQPNTARSNSWWPITLNFPWIRPGDFVYFYTLEADAGVVGFAKLETSDTHTPEGPRAKLRLDLAASRALLTGRPLPAGMMARWLNPPQGAVEDVRAATHDIDSALSSVPAYAKHLRALRRGR